MNCRTIERVRKSSRKRDAFANARRVRYPGATDPRFVSDFALKSAQRSLAVAMSFTQEQISNALKSAKYPGFSRDIVSFGLIKEIVSTDAETRVQMALTTNDSAVPRAIKAEAKDVLRKLGVPNPKVLIDIHAPPTGVGSSGVGATRIPGIKHIIAIASGKGGVGKSTVAANLAMDWKKPVRASDL